METFKKWAKSPFGIGTAIAIAGIATFIFIGRWFNLNKSEWAYWVQALGSIGAIIGTWYATKTQVEHAAASRMNEAKSNEIVNAQIAFDLASETYHALYSLHSKLRKAHDEGRRFSSGTQQLEALRLSIQHFSTRPISPLLYLEILCLQRNLSFSITTVHQLKESETVSVARVERMQSRSRNVAESRVKIAKLLVITKQSAGQVDLTSKTTNAIDIDDDGN